MYIYGINIFMYFSVFVNCVVIPSSPDPAVPEITLHPEDQIVHVGDTLVLRCCAKCIPSPPDYHWHCNGVPMRNMRDPVLRIDDVHTYIDGTYTCKVTNKYINDPNNNFVWTRPAKVHVEIVNPSTPG